MVPRTKALDVLWRDGFEGFNLQSRWSIDGGVWEIGNPTSGPGAALGGTNVAATVLAGNYPEGADTRLVRRQTFRVPEAENPRLRFRHWFNFSWDDLGSVQIRVVGGDWETIALYPQVLTSCGRWERASLDLSKYAGKDVQIGFLFHSQVYRDGNSYAAEGWYLDDVEVVSGPQVFHNPENFDTPDVWDHWSSDNGVWEVGKPTGAPAERHDDSNAIGTIIDGNYCDAYLGRDSRLISPLVRVPESANPRLRFRHWFNLSWDDQGSVQVRIAGGDWETIALYPQVLTSCGRWERASLELSKYAGKDVQIGFLFHSQVYRDGRSYVAEGWYIDDLEIVSGSQVFRNPEDFEQPDFWDHWSSDNGVWEVGKPTGAPAERHDGSNAIGTIIDGNYCDSYYGRDSRLISPIVHVPVADNPRLRFRHWFNFSWDDQGSVQVRVLGGDWETLVLYPQVLTSCSRWERASLDLSKYAGKDVQIGFLFHSQVYRDDRSYVAEGWYLDDLEVVSGSQDFRNPENFEQPDLWDHWTSDNGVWEVGKPTGAPAERHDGSNAVGTIIDGNYCDAYFGRDSRLISPWVHVPNAENPRLRFRHWFNLSWDDQGSVQIRVVGGDWETLAAYPQVLTSCGRWERASVDLSKYAGKDVQVGFLFHAQIYRDGNAYVAEGWYLDDVEVVSGPQVFRNPENFDQPDVWDHWSSDNGVWEVGKPTGAPAERHDGSNAVGTILDGNYCDAYYGRDSRLTSPMFHLPESALPELRVTQWFNFGLDDYGSVEISTNANEWVELKRLSGPGTGQWTSTALDLSRFSGKSLRLGFRFHSQINANGNGYTGLGWYLDDVQIRLGLLRITPDNLLSEGLLTSETNVVEFTASGGTEGTSYALLPPSPKKARIDSSIGLASWLPEECDGPGFHWLRVALIDPGNALQPVDFEDVPVQLLEAPTAPVTEVDIPLAIQVGEPVQFRASDHAYDPDCPTETLEYLPEANFPVNASLDRFTGELQWTPTLEQASSTHLIRILVTDSSADRKSSVMTVKPVNGVEAPQIQGVRIEAEFLVISVAGSWPTERIQLFSTTELRSPPDPLPTDWVPETQATWSGREIRVPRVNSQQFFVLRRS